MLTPSHLPAFWFAHESPERPFAYGMWLCCCGACRVALRTEAQARPQTQLVLKSVMDRKHVSVEQLSEVLQRGGTAAELLDDPADYVREIFVSPQPSAHANDS